MIQYPTRTYTIFAAALLGVQGVSTLAALTFKGIDQTVPPLLDTTHMVHEHSTLHIISAIVALGALRARRTNEFALGFGLFYSLLAVGGWISGTDFALELQPFDHPFHLVLGGLGLWAWTSNRITAKGHVMT